MTASNSNIQKKYITKIAATKDSKAIIAELIAQVLVSRLDDLAQFKDAEGNNILHLLVRDYPADILGPILQLITPIIPNLVNQTNNQGKIPLVLAHDIANEADRGKVITLLLPLTMDCTIKSIQPLSATLNPDEVLKQYPESKDNKLLAENIRLGCEAVNYCRSLNLATSSHPSKTPYPMTDQHQKYVNDINDKLSKLRQTYNIQSLKDAAEIIEKSAIANCGEFTIVAANKVHQSTDLKISRVSITNGDHGVVVLGLDDKCDLNKLETCNDSAVLIDAWSGKVIPIKRLSQSNLMTFKFCQYTYNSSTGAILRSHNLLGTFNPNYHSLQIDYSWQRPKPINPPNSPVKSSDQQSKDAPATSTQSPHRFFNGAPTPANDTIKIENKYRKCCVIL